MGHVQRKRPSGIMLLDRIQVGEPVNTPGPRAGRRRAVPHQEAFTPTVNGQVLAVTTTCRATTRALASPVIDGIPEEGLLPGRTAQAKTGLVTAISGRRP